MSSHEGRTLRGFAALLIGLSAGLIAIATARRSARRAHRRARREFRMATPAGTHQAGRLASRAAQDPGRRAERTSRRILARHQEQLLDRRQGRRAGSACPTGSTVWFRSPSSSTIPALQARVKRFIDYILDHQQADGWLGPIGDTAGHKPYDVWPLFPLFKALTQYQEATGDPRVIPGPAQVLPEDRPGHRPEAAV